MNDAPRDGTGSGPPGETGDLERRRRALDTGLVGARKRNAPPAESDGRGSALGMAFRIATELLAGLIVGGVVGWQLDAWLGTRPVLFLVFFALGAAAGMINVFRYAYRMNSATLGSTDEHKGDRRPDGSSRLRD